MKRVGVNSLVLIKSWIFKYKNWNVFLVRTAFTSKVRAKSIISGAICCGVSICRYIELYKDLPRSAFSTTSHLVKSLCCIISMWNINEKNWQPFCPSMLSVTVDVATFLPSLLISLKFDDGTDHSFKWARSTDFQNYVWKFIYHQDKI